MKTRHAFTIIVLTMLLAPSAAGQIVSAVMTVTGAEMH